MKTKAIIWGILIGLLFFVASSIIIPTYRNRELSGAGSQLGYPFAFRSIPCCTGDPLDGKTFYNYKNLLFDIAVWILVGLLIIILAGNLIPKKK